MSRVTLYDPPPLFLTRLDELEDEGRGMEPPRNRRDAELLLHVELGFALMERLRLDGEPLTAVWALLSGTPLRLLAERDWKTQWDAGERRAIANARQIVPYSSRFAWEDALRDYLKQPRSWRHYEFTLQNMNSQSIGGAKDDKPRHQKREELYRQCLSVALPFHERRAGEPVIAETLYQFDAAVGMETNAVPVKFSREQIDSAAPVPDWFTRSRSRAPFTLELAELRGVAQRLDERELSLARQYPGGNRRQGHWTRRFDKISYHRCLEDGTLDATKTLTLNLDGFVHLGGMVASGKSTLALLLATHVIATNHDLAQNAADALSGDSPMASGHQTQASPRRLTLVVGDVQTAIRLANQINTWFRDDPEQETPVAVPLLGRLMRDKHLRDFHQSRDYTEHLKRGQPHWGERWLAITCPLQALVTPHDRDQRMDGKPLQPGYEPCQTRKKAPDGKRRQTKGQGVSHLCPLFGGCPSHQNARDMPPASVWITTAGAMARGSLPRHLENRPIHVGELVYEQSDIVVFDEADTVMEWFDDVYAEEVPLTNGSNGVFDGLGVNTETFARQERVPPRGTQRWSGAQRDTQTAIGATLTLLAQGPGYELLRRWVERGYFTPNTLFYKIARRVAGLEEFDSPDLTIEQMEVNRRQTEAVLQPFDELFEQETDPLRPKKPEARIARRSIGAIAAGNQLHRRKRVRRSHPGTLSGVDSHAIPRCGGEAGTKTRCPQTATRRAKRFRGTPDKEAQTGCRRRGKRSARYAGNAGIAPAVCAHRRFAGSAYAHRVLRMAQPPRFHPR